LDVSHNMLRSLPQSIGNVRNLDLLDLSYNKLLYLPISILLLQLEYLNIGMNPFRTQEYKQNNEQNNVQSLIILSANIVLQHRFVAFSNLPTHTRAHARVCTRMHTPRTACTRMHTHTCARKISFHLPYYKIF